MDSRYYDEIRAAELIAEAADQMRGNGTADSAWINISARTSEEGFVMTPVESIYGGMSSCDPVKVSISDGSYEGDTKPGSEKDLHCLVYSLRSDVNFIVSAHRYYASAVSAECRDTGFAPCLEYPMNGTDRNKRSIDERLRSIPECSEFLTARSGLIVFGNSCADVLEGADALEEKCREAVEARTGITAEGGPACDDQRFDVSRINIKALPHVIAVSDPYILECCRQERTVGAYLDDFAKIIGPDIRVVNNDPWEAERALLGHSVTPAARGFMKIPMTGALDRMGGQQPVLNSVAGRSAVLVKGAGAVCAGRTAAEAASAAMTVSRNCAAACYAGSRSMLHPLDARLKRYTFLSRYFKEKTEN